MITEVNLFDSEDRLDVLSHLIVDYLPELLQGNRLTRFIIGALLVNRFKIGLLSIVK